jgi:hypothetical protein
MPVYKISSSLVVNFFLKGRYYYAFTVKNAKKHIFEWNFIQKNLNFLIAIDLINLYQYHAPTKNSPKNSIVNLIF